MHLRSASGNSSTFITAAWIFVCAGILLCGLAAVVSSAGLATGLEVATGLFSYALVSSGLLYTLYKLHG